MAPASMATGITKIQSIIVPPLRSNPTTELIEWPKMRFLLIELWDAGSYQLGRKIPKKTLNMYIVLPCPLTRGCPPHCTNRFIFYILFYGNFIPGPLSSLWIA